MKKVGFTFIIALISILNFSCQPSAQQQVVDVVAKDYRFETVDSLPSGWTTFRLKNMGHAEHFFLLNLLPDTISYQTYHDQVTAPFQIVFNAIKAGKSKMEAAGMLVDSLPSWYFTSVKQMGGTGIIPAGQSTSVTLRLNPGVYAMECYIKEQGVFHTTLGMIRPLKVTEERSGMQPPEADVDLTLVNYEIQVQGQMKSGVNTVAVHFKEHPEVGLGNDVQLVRVNETTEIDSIIYWLDWMNAGGLQSPAPAEFLGGTQEMPVGYTSYFTVDLDPGNYAWISESTAAKGMVKEFTVQ